MDYKRLTIHPLGEDAGAKIGEIVHELNGTLHEKRLLGMLHFEAHFPDGGKAQEALTILLKEKNFVSSAGWIEVT